MVGVFLFLGLGMLGSIILLFGKIDGFFKDRYQITVNFKEASGVIEGSTVRLRGAKIGLVAEKPMLVDGEKIKIVLAIDEDYRIEEGSVFQIETATLLGDKEIVITPPASPTRSYLEAGAVVEGAGPGGLDRLQNEAEGIAEATREVVVEAKTALLKIEESVDEIRKVASQLTMTLDKVNGRILADENLEKVSQTLNSLEKATASFAKLGGDLEPVAGDVREAVAEVRQTNQALQDAIRKVDPAIAMVPDVISSVERTAQSIEKTLADVQRQKGAVGALVGDEELKSDLKEFARNLKEKGILRYKDDEALEEDPRDRIRGRRR